jgi:hypothetical protein
LTAVREGDALHVNVSGENSPENVREYFEKARALCLEHRVSKVLLEENLSGASIGFMAVFEVVTQEIRAAEGVNLHIAFVDRNRTHNKDAMRFAETVALNRGVNARFFEDLTEARGWLEGR